VYQLFIVFVQSEFVGITVHQKSHHQISDDQNTHHSHEVFVVLVFHTLIPLVVNVLLFILLFTIHTAKLSTNSSLAVSTFTNFLIPSLFAIFVLLYAFFKFSTKAFLAAFHSVVSSLNSEVFQSKITISALFTKFKLPASHR
jgi:hypothetical protein